MDGLPTGILTPALAAALGDDGSTLQAQELTHNAANLPEIDQAVTAAYLAGLRAGGWRGRDAQVRHAIAVTGAAKYCWLALMMLQRLANDRGSPGFYDRRGAEQVLRGRAGMLGLVADWGRTALANH